MEDKILIIDGNSLINRAFYAVQRPMITKDGIYTQVCMAFLTCSKSLKNDYAPKYLTVAFDMKALLSDILSMMAIKQAERPCLLNLRCRCPS